MLEPQFGAQTSLFRLIWHQTEFRLMPNQSEKCSYNTNLVWFNKVHKNISLCVPHLVDSVNTFLHSQTQKDFFLSCQIKLRKWGCENRLFWNTTETVSISFGSKMAGKIVSAIWSCAFEVWEEFHLCPKWRKIYKRNLITWIHGTQKNFIWVQNGGENCKRNL